MQERVVGTPMEIEHIVPESLGGRTEEENLWDPETGVIVALFHPRRQAWAEHFAWSADCTRIVGLTQAGRATVIALNLNRASLVRSRRVWVHAGLHPPRDV